MPSSRPKSRSDSVRVLVANDFAVVAAGVAAMLHPYEDRIDVVGTRWTGELTIPDVDVVLYDNFGTLTTDEDVVFREVQRSKAKLAVYTWAESPELVDRALAAGVSGYLSKRMEPEQLVAALELIHAGEMVIPGGRPTTGSATHEATGRWPGLAHDLSGRESEVVALIARGLTNQQIADRTFLSINSIKTYARTAYRKMGVTSRSQAVLWALEHGFVRGSDGEAPGVANGD